MLGEELGLGSGVYVPVAGSISPPDDNGDVEPGLGYGMPPRGNVPVPGLDAVGGDVGHGHGDTAGDAGDGGTAGGDGGGGDGA